MRPVWRSSGLSKDGFEVSLRIGEGGNSGTELTYLVLAVRLASCLNILMFSSNDTELSEQQIKLLEIFKDIKDFEAFK